MTNAELNFNIDITKVEDIINLNFVDNLAKLDVLSQPNGYGVDVFGLIKIETPLGIIYKNTGYDTDDYSSPDIDNTGAVYSKLFSLFTDGILVNGNYTISYKIEYDGSEYYSKSMTFNIDFEMPETTIEVSHFIGNGLAYLQSRDASDYGLTVNSIVQEPLVTYLQTISFPRFSGISDATDTTGNVKVQLWSETTTCKLVSTIYYDELFKDVLCTATLTVTNTVIKEHTVEDDDCGCLYFQCIANLQTKYEENKKTNKVDAIKYSSLLDQINRNWMLKNMAESCGNDSTQYCINIKELAQAEDCLCNTQTDDTPHLITGTVPSVSGSTNQWLYGYSIPSDEIGNNGDFYVFYDTLQYTIYNKLAGVWVVGASYGLKGNAGSNGSNGAAGAAGAAGTNGTTVVLAKAPNETKSITALTLTSFVTIYTFATNLFTALGDKLKITASFMQDGINSQSVYVTMNTVSLGGSSYCIEKQVILNIEITYIATNTYLVTINSSNGGMLSQTLTIASGTTIIGFKGYSSVTAPIILETCVIEKSTGGLLI